MTSSWIDAGYSSDVVAIDVLLLLLLFLLAVVDSPNVLGKDTADEDVTAEAAAAAAYGLEDGPHADAEAALVR